MGQTPRKKAKNPHSSPKTRKVNFQARTRASSILVNAFVGRCSALESKDKLTFTMKNGVNGTVRRLDNPVVHQILAQFREMHLYDGSAEPDEYYVVNFNVQREKIQMLTPETFIEEVARQAHRSRPDFWQGYWPLFYKGAYVEPTLEEGKVRPMILACAIMCDVPTSIVPLMGDPKTARDYFEALHADGIGLNL